MKYMLAPMEKITNPSFRTECHKKGADLTFTEMVRIEALARNNKSTWKKIEITDATPTIIQLIGYKENSLKKFLELFKPQKGFEGFDLNLCCPAPNYVNNGMGAAMMKRISKVKKLVAIIKEKGYSVSVKLRLGLNAFEKEKKVYLALINEIDADFFAVHARHAKEDYTVKADWAVFRECVKTGKKIVANGDIKSKKDVLKLIKMGVFGVMIGRHAINNSDIFKNLK
jgi:tRNA-dihydrouridine synthase B